jgi:hypothetical protein
MASVSAASGSRHAIPGKCALRRCACLSFVLAIRSPPARRLLDADSMQVRPDVITVA